MIKCHICGRTAHQCSGYLQRVNETGVPGVWECRPGCEAPEMDADDSVIAAIEGRFDDHTESQS